MTLNDFNIKYNSEIMNQMNIFNKQNETVPEINNINPFDDFFDNPFDNLFDMFDETNIQDNNVEIEEEIELPVINKDVVNIDIEPILRPKRTIKQDMIQYFILCDVIDGETKDLPIFKLIEVYNSFFNQSYNSYKTVKYHFIRMFYQANIPISALAEENNYNDNLITDNDVDLLYYLNFPYRMCTISEVKYIKKYYKEEWFNINVIWNFSLSESATPLLLTLMKSNQLTMDNEFYSSLSSPKEQILYLKTQCSLFIKN